MLTTKSATAAPAPVPIRNFEVYGVRYICLIDFYRVLGVSQRTLEKLGLAWFNRATVREGVTYVPLVDCVNKCKDFEVRDNTTDYFAALDAFSDNYVHLPLNTRST